MSPILEGRRLSRRYGELLAVDGVSVTACRGEIRALLGENGAGKTTLVKMLCGATRPDSGELLRDGFPIRFASPRDARRVGIEAARQRADLVERFSAAENLMLSRDAGETPMSSSALADAAATLSARLGFALEPRRRAGDLSAGERRKLEIVRCLLGSPSLLILDEPTSALAPSEAEGLFAYLRDFAAHGGAVLYITHKLREAVALCHSALILRRGRLVAELDPRRETPESLAVAMLGQAPKREQPLLALAGGEERLRIDRLSLVADDPYGVDLRDVSLTLRAGEILGIAGIVGNGQTELLAALGGERRAERPDAIRLDGKPCGHHPPDKRRRRGLATIPEERLRRAVVGEMSLERNVLLTAASEDPAALRDANGVDAPVSRGAIRLKPLRRLARRALAALAVSGGDDASRRADSLSGGNLQRFVVGRALLAAPKALVAAYPTAGVDALAAAAVHRALRALARQGSAVAAISEDLEELFALGGSIAFMARGRLSPPVAPERLNPALIENLMAGRFEALKANHQANAP